VTSGDKMGLCATRMTEPQRLAIEKSREIDRQNQVDHQVNMAQVKLLLLGAGESGKTTVLKQMQIIYGKGFSEHELKTLWAPRLNENVITAMKAICEAATDLGLEDQIQDKAAFEQFTGNDAIYGMGGSSLADGVSLVEVGPVIKALWEDPGIQAAWARRSEYQVIESHVRYFENIDQLMQPNYLPTQDDVLLCRSRTMGIVETTLDIDSNEFHIFDVGGQRNERRKWIHCFDEVTAVIFVAALSEFDQVLFEDSRQNRMVEAIDIFHEQVTSSWFKNSAMILFLNKSDLFLEKLQKKAINMVPEWSDYDGPDISQLNPLVEGEIPSPDRKALIDEAFARGTQYFRTKFEQLPPAKASAEGTTDIFCHVTCATNTQNARGILNGCKEMILKRSLLDSGFYA